MKTRWMLPLVFLLPMLSACNYWGEAYLSENAARCIDQGGIQHPDYCERPETGLPAIDEQNRQCAEACAKAPNNIDADRFCRAHCQG